jgi:hypothetical protein
MKTKTRYRWLLCALPAVAGAVLLLLALSDHGKREGVAERAGSPPPKGLRSDHMIERQAADADRRPWAHSWRGA